MNIATPQPSIKDLIAAAGDRLTATERRIVKAVIEDRTLLAFGTVTDLASRVGTSRASIVRFATKLGFGGYTDLQDYARAGMAREISRPSSGARRTVIPSTSSRCRDPDRDPARSGPARGGPGGSYRKRLFTTLL